MTRSRRLLVAAAAIAASVLPGRGIAQRAAFPAQNAEEAYFAIQYRTLVHTVVTGRYARDSLYLPVGATFSELHIDYTLDPSRGLISGFFAHPSDRYRIDVNSGEATVGGRTVTLPDSSFIITDVEIYALPSALARLFPVNFLVDQRNLAVVVHSRIELPVALAAERELRRKNLVASAAIQPPATLRFGRTRRRASLGVLDYSFYGATTSSGLGSSGSASLALGAGGALLGGDYDVRTTPILSGGRLSYTGTAARWRYAFAGARPPVSALLVGRLFSTGLRPMDFDGVRVTNEPLQPRTRMGSQLVTGTTRPGWQVEVYLNDQLIAFAQADAQGHYAVRVPLTYGTSIVRLKLYGPTGRTEVEERRLQVPFVFVPPGRLDYEAEAGWDDAGRLVTHGALAYGLSDMLTARGGVDVLDNGPREQAVPFAALSALLNGNLTFTATAAPGGLYELRHEAFLGTQTSYTLDFTRYPRSSPVDLAGLRQRLGVQAYLPLGPLPFTARLVGDASSYWSGTATRSLETSLALTTSLFRPSLGYRRTSLVSGGQHFLLEDALTAGLIYQIFQPLPVLRLLNGALISGSADFDLRTHGISRAYLEIDRNVTRRGRLGLRLERDNTIGDTRVELRYTLDLATSRSSAAVQRTTTGTTVSAYARGSIGFDGRSLRPRPSARDWLGQAAASFRLFLDRNGDGRYEPGEPLIPGNAIRFRQAVETQMGPDSILRTTDLLPYTRYSVSVDLAAVHNPLWVPRYTHFSFITDASTYKHIDVPFYAGAVIGGTVRRVLSGTPTPISGVRVHVHSLTGSGDLTLSTFSDGTFYHLGLPPGRYLLWVDSAQQRILGDLAVPATRTLLVKPSSEGEDIEGLDFTLRGAAHDTTGADGSSARPGAARADTTGARADTAAAGARPGSESTAAAPPSTAPRRPGSPRPAHTPAPTPWARASAASARRGTSVPDSPPTARARRREASRSASGGRSARPAP